jgi:hypothetical protein
LPYPKLSWNARSRIRIGNLFCRLFMKKGNLRNVFVIFESVGFLYFFVTLWLRNADDIHVPVVCLRKGGFVLRQRIEARNVGWAILDVALSPDGRHLGRWSGR